MRYTRLISALVIGIGLSSTMSIEAFAAGKPKPLNAGKDGVKSNAGYGNGPEAGALLDTSSVTVTTNVGNPYTVPVEGSTTREDLALPASTSVVTKTPVGQPFYANGKPAVDANGRPNTSALKQSYSVTTTTTTWDGEKWVETTQTVVMQNTLSTTTTTDTFEDLDPGRSGGKNQSPEGSTFEDVTVSEPVAGTEVVGPGEPIVEQFDESTSTTNSSSVEEEQLFDPNCQGSNCPVTP
jgi:hypothetical protein